jgi:hypothetical protein
MRGRDSTEGEGSQGLRLLRGEGKPRDATLRSRGDVVSVLVGAAGDLLFKRISAPRAHEIEARVEKVLSLFDRCDAQPALLPILRRELDDLERLAREGKLDRKR